MKELDFGWTVMKEGLLEEVSRLKEEGPQRNGIHEGIGHKEIL